MSVDFFVAGRYVNQKALREVLAAIRGKGKSAYCCIENEYDGHGLKQTNDPEASDPKVSNIEHIVDWKTNPTFKKMFNNDLEALKNAKEFVMVFPAGSSTHTELGIAYGMGKNCYGIGKPEKVETLYLIFDKIFPSITDFKKEILEGVK